MSPSCNSKSTSVRADSCISTPSSGIPERASAVPLKQSHSFDKVALKAGERSYSSPISMIDSTRNSPSILFPLICFLLAIHPLEVWAQTQHKPQVVGRLLTSDPASIEGFSQWSNPSGDPDDLAPTVYSGNKISLERGIALLELNPAQGVVGFCGRTTITILSARETMLYALETGTVSLEVSSPSPERVMTPEFNVEWRGDEAGRIAGVVSFNPSGSLCVQNISGKVRIVNQLTGAMMNLDSGLSVETGNQGLTDSKISRALECGCSVNPSEPRASNSDTFLGLDRPTFSVAEPARPDTSPLVPPHDTSSGAQPLPATPKEVQPAVSESKPAAAGPQSADRSASIPSRSSDKTGELAPTASATLSVSAADLKKSPVKKSFGEKVRGFFQRIFSRKPKPPAAAESAR